MQVSKKKWFYKLLPTILGLVFLAGLFYLAMPAAALAEPADVLEINGDGVANPITMPLAELEAMEQYEHVYSTINTWPTKWWYTARGVKLKELLTLAEIKDDATLIRFISSDGYKVTLTVKELLEDKRYYFPGLKDNHASDGSISGSPEGAQEVEPILALFSAEGSDNPVNMNNRDALLLALGQRAVTEQTNNLFLKYVSKIEVLTNPPEKWDNPEADVPGGVVRVGTEVRLKNKGNDVDKIYYTIDGSTPTVNSPVFNWSASRWWDQRGDVEGINQPIEVKENTVIKMITIGPGKLDSDVVTFVFTADLSGKAVDPTKVPGGPPTGVTLDRSAIDLPIGGSFQLMANVAPFNATDRDVTWSSSDTRVATVDNRGLVTVVGPGTAVITVTTLEGNFTAICVVNGPGGDESIQEADQVVVGSQENPPPEPPVEPPPPEAEQPEPPEEVEPDAGQFVSREAPEVPAVSSVPEDRAQYLAEKEELAGLTADNVLEQTGSDSWQVFEMSSDTIPLPLQIAKKRMGVYAAIVFLLLFIFGAGKRFAEYTRER